MKVLFKGGLCLGIFLFLSVGIYAFIDSYINSDANSTANDKWEILGNIGLVEVDDVRYSQGVRGEMSGRVTSELFGLFTFGNIEVIDPDIPRGECSEGKTYSLSGSLFSDYYEDMSVTSQSYYCPAYNDLNLSAFSNQLGTKILTQNITNILVDYNIFEQTGIGASGQSSLKLAGDTTSSEEVKDVNLIYVDDQMKKIFKNSLDYNIASITKNLTPENQKDDYIEGVQKLGGEYDIGSFENLSENEKYYFFDFEDGEGSDNGYGNKGKNLYIGYGNYFSSLNSSAYTKSITGKNTVIVKGGNIYINADLYNENDANDLLVLIAQRSSDGSKGGNIYIHPDVTNIDAVLVAGGSILSYDGTKIITIEDYNILRKQLLIYGSIFSNNVVGTDEIPYGADGYNAPGELMENNIYDLTHLRTFKTKYASYDSETLCGGDDTFMVPIGIESGGVSTYSWAGKSKCFNQKINPGSGEYGENEKNLRVTDRINSLVVEYNPNINLISPFILSSK